MKGSARSIGVALALLVMLAFGRVAYADPADATPAIPRFTSGPVIDETNTLSAAEISSLDAKLRHYEDSTSTQIAILLVPTLGGYPVEDFAVAVYDSNKFGQAHQNNGALILLALNDHKGWITTGYGLEPTLTDAATSMIYQEIMVPELRKGNVYSASDKATTAMFQVIGGEFKNTKPTSPFQRKNAPSVPGVFFIVLGFFFVLFILRALAGTGARRTVVGAGGGGSGCLGGILQGLFWSSIFNTGRRGWGGGGWSGGSFGGFGGGGFGGGGWGGGGGMTGGGGAGGSW